MQAEAFILKLIAFVRFTDLSIEIHRYAFEKYRTRHMVRSFRGSRVPGRSLYHLETLGRFRRDSLHAHAWRAAAVFDKSPGKLFEVPGAGIGADGGFANGRDGRDARGSASGVPGDAGGVAVRGTRRLSRTPGCTQPAGE